MANKVVLLIGCRDHRQLLRFPTGKGELHGFYEDLPENINKDVFVKERTCSLMGLDDPQGIHVHTYIENQLQDEVGRNIQLAIVEIERQVKEAPEEWLTLPLILRSMERGKGRLAYNKAMQVYAGGLSQELDALEVDEEVRQRLRELSSHE